MIEYKIIRSSDEELHELGEKNWELVSISDGKMYFKRTCRSISEKKPEATSEYIQFRDAYKLLSENGIYSPMVKAKYASLVKEGLHQTIMDSIPLYEKECKAISRPFKNASTFLNQRTWEQKFRITKSAEYDWMNAYLEPLSLDQINQVREIARSWKEQHKKDLTPWVLQNIITKVTW